MGYIQIYLLHACLWFFQIVKDIYFSLCFYRIDTKISPWFVVPVIRKQCPPILKDFPGMKPGNPVVSTASFAIGLKVVPRARTWIPR